ncbi:hypothetical protein [Bacillus sp. P14.5]|uniref:hypothetical protein n=1 Tax=Bacillus sp. P14.5 TaxID=1983400 RepID=UPI000DE873DD|nr:hypothetical protein [Bacillus sp. P14.5]
MNTYFFLEKKLFLILIPLIALVLGIAASYLIPQKAEYVGQATVYTGSVHLDVLNDEDMISKRYGPVDDIYVPDSNFIKLTVNEDTTAKAEKKLQASISKLESDLMDQYEMQLTETRNVIERTENHLDRLEAAQDNYLNRIMNNTLTVEDSVSYAELLRKNEIDFSDEENITFASLFIQLDVDIALAKAKIDRVENDLTFFEKPEVSDINISETDKHTLEYAIAGFIFGLFFTILALILWKYILDARRALKID